MRESGQYLFLLSVRNEREHEVCGVDLMKMLVEGYWTILRHYYRYMLSQMTGLCDSNLLDNTKIDSEHRMGLKR